jgi:putative effector of murein hydrolase LrgA (UPF0299 family)
MIPALAILLLAQLAGETLVRALSLPLPGPVAGLVLLTLVFLAPPRLAEAVRPVAQAILAHLALLFVPAGTGVVGHLDRLGAEALPILAALVVSTLAALVAGAAAFVLVARATGAGDA